MERCVEVLSGVADRWPEDWRIRRRLAQCLIALGRHEEATKIADACVSAHPGLYECLYDLAFATVKAKGEEAAIPTYQRLAALEVAQARRPIALAFLVSVSLKNEQIAPAKQHLNLALELATTAEERANFALLAASLAMLQRDKVAALRFVEQATAAFPDRSHYVVSRVFALLWAGELDMARELVATKLPEDVSLFDRECLQWAARVLSRSVVAADLESWVAREGSQRGFLLMALDAHLARDDERACKILNEAHAHPGKPLLHPLWLPQCVMPACRLSKEGV